MPATYVHLSGADIDKKMLENRGLLNKGDEKSRNELAAIVCKNCHCQNSATARYCTQCGIAFYIKDAMETELKRKETLKLIDEAFDDEEMRIAMARKIMQSNHAMG